MVVLLPMFRGASCSLWLWRLISVVNLSTSGHSSKLGIDVVLSLVAFALSVWPDYTGSHRLLYLSQSISGFILPETFIRSIGYLESALLVNLPLWKTLLEFYEFHGIMS